MPNNLSLTGNVIFSKQIQDRVITKYNLLYKLFNEIYMWRMTTCVYVKHRLVSFILYLSQLKTWLLPFLKRYKCQRKYLTRVSFALKAVIHGT